MDEREYLIRAMEQLQMRVFAELGLDPPSIPKGELRSILRIVTGLLEAGENEELIKETIGKFNEMLQRGPNQKSRYEHLVSLFLVEHLFDEIEYGERQRGLTPRARPVLGTLPTGRINSMTLWVPGISVPMIIFDYGFFLFSALASKAVVEVLPVTETKADFRISLAPDQFTSRIRNTPKLVHQFTEVVVGYAVNGEPPRSDEFYTSSKNKAHAYLAEKLSRSMLLFVVGHEIGHMVFDHHEIAARTKARLVISSDEHRRQYEQTVYDWHQEMLADVYGCATVMRAMQWARKPVPASLAYWGVEFYFTCMDIMSRAVNLLNSGKEESWRLGSHPPAWGRRDQLRKHLVKQVGESDSASPLAYADGITAAAEELWRQSRDEIKRLHRRGVRPARQWLGHSEY